MLMIPLLLFAAGCRSPKWKIEYVHERDIRAVKPGEELAPGCINTNTETIYVMTPIGLKSALAKGYTYEMLEQKK